MYCFCQIIGFVARKAIVNSFCEKKKKKMKSGNEVVLNKNCMKDLNFSCKLVFVVCLKSRTQVGLRILIFFLLG